MDELLKNNELTEKQDFTSLEDLFKENEEIQAEEVQPEVSEEIRALESELSEPSTETFENNSEDFIKKAEEQKKKYTVSNIFPGKTSFEDIFEEEEDKKPSRKERKEKKQNKENTELPENTDTSKKEKKTKLTFGKIVGRFLLVLFTTVLAIALILVSALTIIVKGPSPTARDTMVTTVLESGNLKFIAQLFLTEEEIQEIVNKTSMTPFDPAFDPSKINTGGDVEGNFDENGVEIRHINGSTYSATVMIVKDPSKVKVSTTYPWTEYGKTLDKLVEQVNAVGGINGGLYKADMDKGGSPYGVCVCGGVIQYNQPSGWQGIYMIGFDNQNRLRIEDLNGWSPAKFEEYVKTEGIRDAVAFQDSYGSKENHFVPLVLNGEARELNGLGSGANPRTAIGQRADGAVILLVTDGRGTSGHLGATASDLISIMLQEGAVNAANLDGGSSTSMYYKGEWLQESVTLYYPNSSWHLPTSFVVMGGN